jgi:D-lactate dehydrogenase
LIPVKPAAVSVWVTGTWQAPALDHPTACRYALTRYYDFFNQHCRPTSRQSEGGSMKNGLHPKPVAVLPSPVGTTPGQPADGATKVVFFSSRNWVRQSFAPAEGLDFDFLEPRLDLNTASLAAGHPVVCAFVNDRLDAPVLQRLQEAGVRLVALRCAGYNNVDLPTARELGIAVARVPAYSPYAVAEHAVGMIMALNRRYHRAWSRVRDGNFNLDGLLGFDIRGKTVGVVGTGRIGQVFAGIMHGFGARVIAYDRFPSEEFRAKGIAEYVDLESLYRQSDIISLHCPLTQDSYHMINGYSLKAMKRGVMVINTSRGPLIDSDAAIEGLKSGQIGYLGLDVYEEEEELFFQDLSDQVIQDDVFVRLESFPNVLITAHQAFFTKEALDNIAQTTVANIRDWLATGGGPNLVR